MTQRRRYILLSTLVILVCYFGYNYVYKDHRDISAEVSEIEKIEEGMSVIIKGRCIGFDDLFGIVKLDQSSIVK